MKHWMIEDKSFKESTGETVKAHEKWFVIATINPLTHVGTKVPPQLLSRFPVRIRLEYPPEEIELEIIKKYVSNVKDESIQNKTCKYFTTGSIS